MNDEPNNEDAEWLRSVVDRQAPKLLRYAASILRDRELARDAVQETFVRLWRQPRSGIEPRLDAWLFRVCRNQALDRHRKEARMTSLDGHPPATQPADSLSDPAASAEASDTHARVLRLLDALPQNQCEVVRLKFHGGLSYKEIAEVTDLSVSNVGYLLHTALRTLRAKLTAAGE